MDLRMILANELERRRRRNPRYSLRAFARSLGIHHTALSQIIQRQRRLTARTIRRIGPRLHLDPRQLSQACLAEDQAAILELLNRPGFRPDARWISIAAGIPLDAVAIALHHLLAQRRLLMTSPARWTKGGVQ